MVPASSLCLRVRVGQQLPLHLPGPRRHGGGVMTAGLPGPAPVPDERARLIDGLRVLASALEQNPGIPLPYDGTDTPISFYFLHAADPRAELAAAARALPCSWRKSFRDDAEYAPGQVAPAVMKMTGQIGGLSVELVAYRDAVCERVVTGTEDREVEVVVTPAVVRKVTKPVETYDWVCHPVMSAPDGEAQREVTS
jgi:hypothetical protein